jgi:hypothetical protein
MTDHPCKDILRQAIAVMIEEEMIYESGDRKWCDKCEREHGVWIPTSEGQQIIKRLHDSEEQEGGHA